jgi:uncharacterized protein
VISHSLKVEKVATSIAGRIAGKGIHVDRGLVSLGALVHDIGRSRSHGLDHGVLGAGIINGEDQACHSVLGRDREALAKICERHIGGGIPAPDAERSGLPPRDFIPVTLEEKIVAHADNLVGNGVLTVEESRAGFVREFGASSPVVRRVADLANEIEMMAGSVIERDHDTGEDLQESPGREKGSGKDTG